MENKVEIIDGKEMTRNIDQNGGLCRSLIATAAAAVAVDAVAAAAFTAAAVAAVAAAVF